MPTYSTTARRSLRKLLGTNKVKDTDAGIGALADDVDALLLVRSFGKAIIPTEESVTTSYALMPTPDVVSGLVLPTDGLIVVAYQAMWKESVQNAARAQFFLDGNSMFAANASLGGYGTAQARINKASLVGAYAPLASHAMGLASAQGGAGSPGAYAGDATTGQFVGGGLDESGTSTFPLGGVAYIFAAAGTHDISVRYQTGSGSVTAKNRRLWAWTLGF